MAYSVPQRTNEVGIRMALGASRGDILRLILKHGSRLALAGIAIGLVASVAATRVLSDMLFSVSPKDPGTFIAIALLLLAVVLLACYIPSPPPPTAAPLAPPRYD